MGEVAKNRIVHFKVILKETATRLCQALVYRRETNQTASNKVSKLEENE